MFIQPVVNTPFNPIPCAFEEEPDTCPSCQNGYVDGKICPVCGGSGDTDPPALGLEEEEEEEEEETDNDAVVVDDGVSSPCPHCGKDVKATVTLQ